MPIPISHISKFVSRSHPLMVWSLPRYAADFFRVPLPSLPLEELEELEELEPAKPAGPEAKKPSHFDLPAAAMFRPPPRR